MEWTKEKLAAKSPHDRAILYKNARRLGTPAAFALVKMIEEAGLPFSDTACPTNDNPLTIAIYDVVFSVEGRAAAVDAVEKGFPPLAGVDPLLLNRLGVDYGPHNMTTSWAGSMIAQLMRSLGYKQGGGNSPLPAGCVARTGQKWMASARKQ
jgi:hypothetical protein